MTTWHLLSSESVHRRFRCLLSHSFFRESTHIAILPWAHILVEKALREQEKLIQSHIEVLVSKLGSGIEGPGKGCIYIVRAFFIVRKPSCLP